MRYSTKAVCGYPASAAQETLLLSWAGHGSDSACLKMLWMEICLKNIKHTAVKTHGNQQTEASPC